MLQCFIFAFVKTYLLEFCFLFYNTHVESFKCELLFLPSHLQLTRVRIANYLTPVRSSNPAAMGGRASLYLIPVLIYKIVTPASVPTAGKGLTAEPVMGACIQLA